MKSLLSIAILFIALSFVSLNLNAQGKTDSITIAHLKVLDAFSEQLLSKAHVVVYEADSITVLADSMRYFDVSGFFAFDLPRREIYVVRITCPGYPVTYETLKIPKWVTTKYPVDSPSTSMRRRKR